MNFLIKRDSQAAMENEPDENEEHRCVLVHWIGKVCHSGFGGRGADKQTVLSRRIKNSKLIIFLIYQSRDRIKFLSRIMTYLDKDC